MFLFSVNPYKKFFKFFGVPQTLKLRKSSVWPRPGQKKANFQSSLLWEKMKCMIIKFTSKECSNIFLLFLIGYLLVNNYTKVHFYLCQHFTIVNMGYMIFDGPSSTKHSPKLFNLIEHLKIQEVVVFGSLIWLAFSSSNFFQENVVELNILHPFW